MAETLPPFSAIMSQYGQPEVLPTIATIPPPVINPKSVPVTIAHQIIGYISAVAANELAVADSVSRTIPKSPLDGANNAQDFAGRRFAAPNNITSPILSLPPPPNTDGMVVDFDAALKQVKSVVDGVQQSWLFQYFPASLPGGLDPLLAQITNGTIITDAMQEIFWSRAKYQTQRDAARFEDEAITAWAARGFSMPGGVINKQIARKNQELFNANADLAAQQAIKALDIQIDAVKFAAEIGTRLRLGLISGMTALVEAYARLPASAAAYAESVSAARRAAYAAVVEYNKVLIQSAQIKIQVDETNASNYMRAIENQTSFISQYVQAHINAQVQTADVYARQSAAAISGLNGVSTIGIQTDVR